MQGQWSTMAWDNDDNKANMVSDLDNSRRRYIRSLVHEVYVAQLKVAKRELPTEDMTREYRDAFYKILQKL